MNSDPISVKEMKVMHLIAGEKYPDTSRKAMLVLNKEIYWFRDEQWWTYPRTPSKMKDLLMVN